MQQAEAGHNALESVRVRSWLIIAAVVAVSAPAFRGVFQFDDYNVIVDNEAVHSFSAWAADLAHGIRPLLKLSYTLNWASGWGAFGFHLFNTAVHTVNCVLVFLLSRRLLARCSLPEASRKAAAFGAALLFAVHPVQTEAVTYICGRSMSLMALFYFGSVFSFDRGLQTGRKSLYYLLSPLLFLAALAVRETAITLPFALLLWQLCGKPAPGRELFRNLRVHVTVLAAIVFVLLVHPGYHSLLEDGMATRAMDVNLLNQVTAVSYLLSRFVLIHRLNIDPNLPYAPGWTPMIIAETLALLLLVIAGFILLRKRPWVGFGLLWFFLHLVPTNSVIPRLDLANERHLYIAGWGLFIALSVEVSFLTGQSRAYSRAVAAAVVLLLLTLGAGTVMRNTVYWSEVSFWEDAVKKSPDNARAHNNLGYAYFESGRRQQAAAEYTAAIRLRPGYERAGANLRALLATEKKQDSPRKGY